MKPVQDPLGVADWRRSIAELYAAVRDAPEPAQAWRRWRDDRDALFRGHPASPLDAEQRAGFTRLSYFGYDPALRFLVELEPLAATTAEEIDLGDDGTLTLYPSARTLGLSQALGAELTVYWIASYGGGLFLPFADATSERETYGGGRYLLDTIKGADLGVADGRTVLDFNFAYNPSCSYSPQWTCPLALPVNRLPGAIRAGEMMPD